MTDFFLEELRDRFAATPGPSARLLAAVRDEGPPLRARHRARIRRRAFVAVAFVAALTAASFTPPGRAATGWVARVAGFGESPTLPQVEAIPGTAVVIDSGQLSDGTPFEVVAKGVVFGQNAGPAGSSPALKRKLICFQVDWPQNQARGQGGACTDRDAAKRGGSPALETSALMSPPGAEDGEAGPSTGADAPGVFVGIIDHPNIAGVRMIQRSESDSTETEIPSKVVPIKGELLRRLGGGDPVRVFVSTLDESQIQAMNSDEVAIAAVAFDAQGHVLGRSQVLAGRCAELMNAGIPQPGQRPSGEGSTTPVAPPSPDALQQCQDEAWNSGG